MSELFHDERGVTRAILAEYVAKLKALEAARDEFNCVVREITGRLICGEPVEPGPLSPEFDPDWNLCIVVGRQR